MSHPYPVAPTYRPARLPPHPKARSALVLGIIGVAGFFMLIVPAVLGPIAWYHAAVARREAEREPTRWSGSGEARTGLVLGILATALLAGALVLAAIVLGGILLVQRYDSGYGT